MKVQYYSTCILLLITSVMQVNAQQFSKEQIVEDLQFLRESLEDAHYNLFAYTPKEAFDKNYNTVKGQIKKDSFSLLEATSLFQHVISKANNGHTEIGFPAQAYLEYLQGGGTVFPLELAFENNKALIRKNWSGQQNILPGDELLTINNQPIEKVLEKIYPLVSAERLYFKKAKIELFSFPRYYWQAFGEKAAFEVKVKQQGKINTYMLSAVAGIDGYEMKRDEIISGGLEMRFFNTTAYINPGGFGGDEKKYRHFIDSAFAAINKKESKNLIIDLRNNPGGDDSFSDYLVSYIANKPFRWNAAFSMKTSKFLKEQIMLKYDTTNFYWQKALNAKDGEVYSYTFDDYIPQPESKRFDGNVYVLVNRQSYSQSTVTAAQIQDYGLGSIVGEETGEYPSLYASVFYYQLPNTGITVGVSKGKIVRVNGSTKAEGVMPDIMIKDYLLDEKDEILDGLLERIESQQSYK